MAGEFERELPIAIAHRGGLVEGTPENTIDAFVRAESLGYQRLETDVRLTRPKQGESELLAVHGVQSDGTEGEDKDNNYVNIGGGEFVEIASITQADRFAFRRQHGLYIPTLEDVMYISDDIHWNIDAKARDTVEPLLEVVKRFRAFGRVTLASFDAESTARLRAGSPEGTSTALTFEELMQIYLASSSIEDRVEGLPANSRAQVPTMYGDIEITTEPIMDAAKRSGVKADIWTINDAAIMEDLLDLGVDGIFTDELVVLRRVLARRGLTPASTGQDLARAA